MERRDGVNEGYYWVAPCGVHIEVFVIIADLAAISFAADVSPTVGIAIARIAAADISRCLFDDSAKGKEELQ